MKNKKKETLIVEGINTTQIIIIACIIIFFFFNSIFLKADSVKSSIKGEVNIPTGNNVPGTSVIETTNPAIPYSSMDFDFICPENQSDQERTDSLENLITEYANNFPKFTMTDFIKYEYSLLIKNNCQKTLDYIKGQANGEDPLTSFIEKSLQSIGENKSNLDKIETIKEKTTAEIITEWTPRVVLVVCKWIDPNTGKLIEAGSGSGTLNYFSNSGYNIITNRHVVTNKQGVGANECINLFPWDKDFTVQSDGIRRGVTEDYAFIKLPDDPFLSKFSKEGLKTCPLNSVSIGDKLVILGFPSIGAQSTITATEGIISGIDQNYFITSAKIDQGNSGGAAILIKDDCYLGIPSASMVGEIESLGRILKWNFAIN